MSTVLSFNRVSEQLGERLALRTVTIDVDARRIRVEASNNVVTLTGSVHSWLGEIEAQAAAWGAPGVTQVVNHLEIMP